VLPWAVVQRIAMSTETTARIAGCSFLSMSVAFP
jgi:hypothetical protein